MFKVQYANDHSPNFSSCNDKRDNMLPKMSNKPIYEYLTHPSCQTQDKAMKKALRVFKIKPKQILYFPS